MSTVNFAGIDVDNITIDEALACLEAFIKNGKPHLITTPNPEMIVKAQKETEFKEIINHSDLRLPDGISMVVVSRILCRARAFPLPLKERVSGIDFMLKAIELASRKGYKVFLLGSEPGVAEKAAQNLKNKFPSLHIAGTHHGYFTKADENEVIAKIRHSNADILFAGLGHGRQEKWLSDHLKEISVPASVGIGGSLDVISGKVKRAPVWTQKLYIEWLYRLITQPWRGKRQIALAQFLWLVFRPKFPYN